MDITKLSDEEKELCRMLEMENEDEALPESLPEFERRLAAAIDTIGFMPAADLNQVRQVSWDALCGKIVNLWNNL